MWDIPRLFTFWFRLLLCGVALLVDAAFLAGRYL